MQSKIDTIIIGGTFNPVHIGHLHLAEEVRKSFSPSQILIVPSYISAHKKGEPVVESNHRLEMLKIACERSIFQIETCELERKGISYSIDTIRYITKKYKLDSEPGLLIGDDLAAGFDDWQQADAVAAESRIIVACRDLKKLDFGYRHIKINNLMLNISSSDIRKRIIEGRACRYLLPAGVYEYIVENKLYGDR